MELKLTETRKFDDKVLERYEIARYTVRVFTYESGYKSIDVRKEKDDYLPDIYCRDDLEGNAIAFEVQTTTTVDMEVDAI